MGTRPQLSGALAAAAPPTRALPVAVAACSSSRRPQRKQVHAALHSAALVLAVLGLTAAWRSHTLKEPPIPNLYSPHSWLGVAALLLMAGQVGICGCRLARGRGQAARAGASLAGPASDPP